MKPRDILAVAGAALISTLVLAGPWADRLDGLSLDALHGLRDRVLTPVTRDEVPLAIVAIDEATYRLPPFRSTPRAMWTREIARVLNAMRDAGVGVVGFDAIFPTSAEKFVPGFDREFLLALRGLAEDDAIVLSRVQHSDAPISPHPGQSYAVGHGRNIRVVNMLEDLDGIIRRAPLAFSVTGSDGTVRREPAFAVELAARARGARPTVSPSGALLLDGRRVPGSRGNALTLNFDTSPGALRVHSLADLYACAGKGRTDFFREHFAGKAVLLGLVLDVEDRKLTSARLATGDLLRAAAPRCSDQVASGPALTTVRDSLPGVFVQATAIANILRGDGLVVPQRGAQFAVLLTLTLSVAVLIMTFGPIRGAALSGLGLMVWLAICLFAFREALALPVLDGAIAAGLTVALLQAYRFALADKDKRFLRRAFAHYLAPAVVDRLVEADEPPALGEESRAVSVLFSDLADFTAISESMTPEALVAFLNEYLTEMTDIVEARGGFVDKYVGDAIVAVFGAPLYDSAHARRAVEAALDCRERLIGIRHRLGAPGNRVVAAPIGVNSGMALVGNIGSKRRFNYTVIGDTANLAARLEGANKAYGTDILISENTAAACRDAIVVREVDRVCVVGREAPVTIFEPLGRSGIDAAGDPEQLERFARALEDYRAGHFSTAVQGFDELAKLGDRAAGRMATQARKLAANPPDPDWDGVSTLDVK